MIDRRGTERGSPDQAYPKFKANTTLDWTLGSFNASVTGRYIQHVTESGSTPFGGITGNLTNVLGSRFYVDAQVNWSPPILDHSLDADGRRQQPDRQGSAGLLHLQHQQLRPHQLRHSGAVLLWADQLKMGYRHEAPPAYTPPPAPPPRRPAGSRACSAAATTAAATTATDGAGRARPVSPIGSSSRGRAVRETGPPFLRYGCGTRPA